MSAELLSRPRPPINYGNKVVRPLKGFTLEQLEHQAWKFWEMDAELSFYPELGRTERFNRSVMHILQLIIEQHGRAKQS